MFLSVNVLNKKLLAARLTRALKQFGVSQFILFVYQPTDLPLLEYLKLCISCYYVYDELAEMGLVPKGTKDVYLELDRKLTKSCDFVFASSEAQMRGRIGRNKNCVLMRNGVDYHLFAQAADPSVPVARELRDIPPPRVGYLGAVDWRIDVPLLFELCSFLGNKASVVLVGPIETSSALPPDSSRWPQNLYALGRRRHRVLPSFLRGLDVCIIPFVLTPASRAMYPQNVNEYLAAGKTLVATALPELEIHKTVINIAATQAEFCALVDQALRTQPSPAEVALRQRVARENSWDARVAYLNGILCDKEQELLSAR